MELVMESHDGALMFEMYFAEAIDLQKLCDAIAKHLFVRREDVGIVPLHYIDTKNTAVVIEDIGDGDFPLGVTIHTELVWFHISEIDLAQKLCASLQTKCLISDNGNNPYSWLLVEQKSVQQVLTNPELFDGQCIFKISS